MKVAVCTPSRGLVGSRTIEAVLANLAGHESVGWFLSHDLPIPECAENVVERALGAGADVIWFVEEDVAPPVGSLSASLALLDQGHAVAAIDYPIQQGLGCLSRDAAGEIIWVGLGCTLITREAFDKVARPWFRSVDGRAYGGHDIYFCREVMRAGLRIGQVPGMVAKHVRLVSLGKSGTNMGCHEMRTLDRIDRPYVERRTSSRLTFDPPGTVVLVPRRTDGGERDRLWTWCRDWWERTFDVPIFEGVHEGPDLFSRALALNRAAALAGDWTVAIVMDADTIPVPERMREAVLRAHLTGQMVLPYDDRRELEPGETELVMHGSPFLPAMGRDFGPAVSGAVAVSRRLWDVVGGFDESFVGWGAEDNDFADACRRTGGEIVRLPGPVYHLYHERHPDATETSPVLQENRRRWKKHRAEWQDWRTLYRAHRPTVSNDPAGGRIPPILHRVVIGLEPDTSRRWWARFGELHPTWDLRTHALPFDPKAWPLTSWLFPHTVHPAQLADFIRLEALWNDGGIYVDWDIEPYRPFDPLLPLEGFVGWALPHIAANGVMGFRPHHPAVGKALDLAMAAFVADRENLISCGPVAITEAAKGRSDVLMLPPQSFYASGHVADPTQTEGQYATDPWVYVVHWGAGSWKEDHPWKPEHEGRQPRLTREDRQRIRTEQRQRFVAEQERLRAARRERMAQRSVV